MSQYKTVELGPLVGENRVIRTGLAKDDSVIVNGLAKVRPGMPVDAKPAEKKVAEATVK
jgi:multidrug efflux system membrane fusion protein